MYSDDSNSKKSNENTLGKFLYSLYPDEDDEKSQAYSFPFHFFQDILVKSVLSSSYEFLFRTIFYITFDFFIVFSAPRVPWFESFFPDKEPLTYSYITSKVALQVVSALVIILVFNIILLQWVLFVTYDPIQHLSEKSATFLHITFYYLPPLISILLGFLFGCLLLLNSTADMTTSYCTILSIFTSIAFIFFTISYLIYCTFTRYSLLIRRGLFSTWEPPYSIASLVIFFIITASLPFISSSFRKSCTIFALIALIWSLSMIYSRQKSVYLSSIAYFIEIKVVFDGIFFSVLTLINIWVDIPFHYTLIIMQVLFFTSFFVSAVMSSSAYLSVRSSFHEDGSINQANFPNSISCITAIRISLNFSMKTFIQHDFLKWMVKNRFSSDLVPDIVRLNLVLKNNLNDFQIPAASFGPLELISLKFLAFQVRQYEKFILGSPDHPSISYAIEEARRLMQIVENVSNDFWTNRDYEQLSIAEYGKKVFRNSCFIRNSALSYPHSTDIQNLWLDYCKLTVRTPSKAIIKSVHEFTYIENPGNTIYLFLNQELPEDFDIRSSKRIDSTTEHFISSYVESAIKPISNFYRIVPFLILLIGIFFSVFFAFRANRAFTMFSNNVKLLTLSLSMCIDSLNSADLLVQLPSVNFISKTLQISLDAAAAFRSDIFVSNPIYQDINSYMSLFDPFDFDINYSFCPKFTLGLMIIFDYPEINENIFTCHVLWTAAYASQINEIAQKKYTHFAPFYTSHDKSKINADEIQGIIVVIIALIFIIAFIIITLHQRKKIKKLILAIENIVAMNNEICERGEPYIGFSAYIYFLLIFLLITILFLYFIIYVFPIRSLENKMIKLANQTMLVANVCRYSTIAMSSSIIEVGLKQQLNDDSNNIDDPSNRTMNLDFENLTLINRFIIAIQKCRRMFVKSLIDEANAVTLCGLDDILVSATNWIPSSSSIEVAASQQSVDQIKSKIIQNNNNNKSRKITSNNKNKSFKIISNNKRQSSPNITNNYDKSISNKNTSFTEKVHNNKNKSENVQNNEEKLSKNTFFDKIRKIYVGNKLSKSHDSHNEIGSVDAFDWGALESSSEFSFGSEIEFEEASKTSLSMIVFYFAQLLNDDNMTAESFNFLLARLMFKTNISTLLINSFPEIASLKQVTFAYIDENFWIYFVLVTLLLIIAAHLLFFQIRCQQRWFFGISVLIRRAMAKYPERFIYIVGAILEDKPKYFDGLPIPIVVHDKKGTIVYANQIVMQYTKHTMDQTIGQPYSEFFTENSTKYTDLTFSMEKQSFINLDDNDKKKSKNKNHHDRNQDGKDRSDNEDDDNLDDLGNDQSEDKNDVYNSDYYDLIILRDTSKFLELQKTYNDLKERVTPDLGKIPSRGRLIFIECRFKTESMKPDSVFSKIENISLKYKEKKSDKKIESINKHFNMNISLSSDDDNDDDDDNNSKSATENDKEKFFDFKDENGDHNDRCITVISCGASYLTAIARIGCEEEAIRFVLDLSSDVFMNFRASITEGVGTVFGLLEGGSLVVVAGDVSRRATEANLYGLWGRIYIDYSLIERSGIENELKNEELEKDEKSAADNNSGPLKINAGKFMINSQPRFPGLLPSSPSQGPGKAPPSQLQPKLPSQQLLPRQGESPAENVPKLPTPSGQVKSFLGKAQNLPASILPEQDENPAENQPKLPTPSGQVRSFLGGSQNLPASILPDQAEDQPKLPTPSGQVKSFLGGSQNLPSSILPEQTENPAENVPKLPTPSGQVRSFLGKAQSLPASILPEQTENPAENVPKLPTPSGQVRSFLGKQQNLPSSVLPEQAEDQPKLPPGLPGQAKSLLGNAPKNLPSSIPPRQAENPAQNVPKLPSGFPGQAKSLLGNAPKNPPENAPRAGGAPPSAAAAPNPQAGKFGLAKFGLGFGLGKSVSAPAMPKLKKSLIVSISPLSKL